MLEVRALGRLEARYRGDPLSFPTQKSFELLCYILLKQGRPVGRELAAESLWPMRPPGRARRSLSTALWRLRRVLRTADPSAPDLILTRKETIELDPAIHVWFDVEEFERSASAALEGPLPCDGAQLERLNTGVRLYEGPLLDGAYGDWCLRDRERLQLLFVRSLKRLLLHHRTTGAFDAAVTVARRLLALDPLQEDVHRELMRCFEASGRRALALEQYERCRRVLREELSIEPMAETRVLHARIRSDVGAAVPPVAHEAPSTYAAALDRFRSALEALEASWAALQAEASPNPSAHP